MVFSIDEMIAHFEQLTHREVRDIKRKPLFKPKKRFKVMYNPDTKRLLVCVFFGSTTHFDQPKFRIKDLACLFRMPYSSAARIIKDFRDSGYDL